MKTTEPNAKRETSPTRRAFSAGLKRRAASDSFCAMLPPRHLLSIQRQSPNQALVLTGGMAVSVHPNLLPSRQQHTLGSLGRYERLHSINNQIITKP